MLQDAKPHDRTVQRPPDYELLINLKSPNLPCLTLPLRLLGRKDEAIG
jgi:hypothetical protein